MSNTPFNPQPDEPQKPNEKLEESTSIGIPPPISDYISKFISSKPIDLERKELIQSCLELEHKKESNRSKIIFSIVAISGVCILTSFCLILLSTFHEIDKKTIHEFFMEIVEGLLPLFLIIIKLYFKE
jgi:hypothetical protein